MSTLLKITGSNQGRERNKHDFYPTPDYATEALLDREKFTDVWEPACGDGAISKVLIKNRIKTISTDLVDYGYGDGSGRDFLLEQERLAPEIITNPPFSLALEFAQKAMDLGVEKLALLVRLQFLEGVKRGEFFKRFPPKHVYVFSKRLSFNVSGEFQSGGVMAFAWFVFKQEKDNSQWLSRVSWI